MFYGLFFAWFFFFGEASETQNPKGADTIFFGGDIVTVDDKMPSAEAVAVSEGRIVFVGAKDKSLEFKGDNTKLIDLQGKTLMPGFIDPHTHIILNALALDATDVSTFKYKTAEEIFDILKEAVKKGPVFAVGFDPSLMNEPIELDFITLDKISTTVPIVVLNKSNHIAYGNHKAFELANIHENSPNPEGASFERKDGKLTGIVNELLAVGQLASAVTNNITPKKIPGLIKRAIDEYAIKGFTTITDMALGIPIPTPLDNIKIMQEVSQDANARVQGYVVFNLADKITDLKQSNNERFKVLGIKFWADGSIQGYSAAMKENYLNKKTKGTLNFSQDKLTQMIIDSRKKNFQVAVHANGDQAIEDTLHAFEAAQKAVPSTDPRFRLEHASIVDPNQWERVANVKATPSFTEVHVYYWGNVYKNKILGVPRVDWLDAAKTAKNLGLKFSFNEDQLTPPNPLLLIQAAVTRETQTGDILNPEQKISVEDAIKAMTIYPAWQSFREKELGSIEKGKLADFVILEQNPAKVEPNKIKDIKIVSTWIEGKKTFKDD